MSEPIVRVGNNCELDEDVDGNVVLRNTATGATVTLAAVVEELAADPHDNTAHTEVFVADGDGVERDVYVSADGTIPAGAGADDIVLTEIN